MQAYLAAHDDFITWLDAIDMPTPAEVDERLHTLALTAAARGMGSTHWAFVVDGLVVHIRQRRPNDFVVAGYVARGLDLCSRWRDL